MAQSSINDDFELSNCSDSTCQICHPRGYPKELVINDYHKREASAALAVVLNWVSRADFDSLTPSRGA